MPYCCECDQDWTDYDIKKLKCAFRCDRCNGVYCTSHDNWKSIDRKILCTGCAHVIKREKNKSNCCICGDDYFSTNGFIKIFNCDTCEKIYCHSCSSENGLQDTTCSNCRQKD